MDGRDPELKKELDATLQTRKELGPEYESELVESFLEKLDKTVDRRVRRQLAEQQMVVARGSSPRTAAQQASQTYPEGLGARLGLAVASLVLAIPLSAIAAVNTGLPGLLVCWGGIVAVNGLQASRSWFDFGSGSRSRGDGGDRKDDAWD